VADKNKMVRDWELQSGIGKGATAYTTKLLLSDYA